MIFLQNLTISKSERLGRQLVTHVNNFNFGAAKLRSWPDSIIVCGQLSTASLSHNYTITIVLNIQSVHVSCLSELGGRDLIVYPTRVIVYPTRVIRNDRLTLERSRIGVRSPLRLRNFQFAQTRFHTLRAGSFLNFKWGLETWRDAQI